MDIALLPSRIKDAVRLCDNSSFPKFVGFLTEEEAAICEPVAQKLGAFYAFFGGYEDAQRRYFGVFPPWCDDYEDFFPIKALTFTYREADSLSHRHFLGTFMSLGITRESVGDILVEQGRAVAFFSDDLADFVKSQVEKVSKVGVTVSEGFTLPLPGMSGFKEITDTVASSRLDCVVAALANCSRSSAAELIDNKLVSVNSVLADKTVKTVQNGDKITLRGKGKFIIESIDTRSKKDRLILKAKKYI